MLLGRVKQNLMAGAFVACAGLAASDTDAAVLTVIDGQLAGAQNVEIDGALYDVSFSSDSCIAVFGGCNEASDFAFTTVLAAKAAAQALIDQVFLDGPEGLFDTDVSATLGCEAGADCLAIIPFDVVGAGPWPVQRTFARNSNDEDFDAAVSGAGGAEADSVLSDHRVWAVFTATGIGDEIPTPGMVSLLVLGLAGIALARRKRNGRV